MSQDDPRLARAMSWIHTNSQRFEFDKKYYTQEFLVQLQKDTPNCPICDVVIDYSLRKKYTPNGPSLDRLDSLLGYIPYNVNIICRKCNIVKHDGGSADFQKLIDWMNKIINGLQLKTGPLIKIDQLEKGNTYLKISKRIMLRTKQKRAFFDPKYITVETLVNILIYNTECPACSVVFDFGGHSRRNCTVDQFIPGKGYIKNNINLLCHHCNTLKNDASLKELIQMYEYLKSKGM